MLIFYTSFHSTLLLLDADTLRSQASICAIPWVFHEFYFDNHHYTYASITLKTILSVDYVTHVQHSLWWLLHVSVTSCICVLYFDCSIMLAWSIYLVVCPNEVMSGRLVNTKHCPNENMSSRLVNTCSAGCSNCKCCIDNHLTFPVLSCTSNTLSEIFLQFQKLGLYF